MSEHEVLEILMQGFSTRAEAADRFGVTMRTIDRWIRAKLLDAIKINGSVRITLQSQSRLIEDGRL